VQGFGQNWPERKEKKRKFLNSKVEKGGGDRWKKSDHREYMSRERMFS